MPRTHPLFSVCAAVVLCLTGTAVAQQTHVDPTEVDPTEVEPEPHAASWTFAPEPTGVERPDDSLDEGEPVTESYAGWTALGYLIWPYGPVIAHGVHGRLGIGFVSLAGFALSTFGGAFLGLALHRSDDDSAAGHGGLGPAGLGAMMAGMVLGMITWIAIDLAVLSKREVVKRSSVRPRAQLDSQDRQLGLELTLTL